MGRWRLSRDSLASIEAAVAAEGLSLVLFFRASLRSLWSPLIVLLSLGFALVGAAVLVDSRTGSGTDIASVLIGVGVVGIGLASAWGGVRMGVVRTPSGLTVRELFGGETYERGILAGFSVGEEEHDMLPLKVVFPVLRLAEADDVPVMSLATYGLFPGARKRAARAAATMAAWTGRPVLE